MEKVRPRSCRHLIIRWCWSLRIARRRLRRNHLSQRNQCSLHDRRNHVVQKHRHVLRNRKKIIKQTPAFAEQTSDYTAVIQEEKEWLNVIYETEQKGLQVEITGNKNLQKGKNMIKLIVKNADGAQSVYQVEVTVQPEQETMAPESGQNVPPGDQLAGNATAKPQVDASEEEMRIEKQRMQYIVGIMAAFCGLLILGIISLIRRYRSQNLK